MIFNLRKEVGTVHQEAIFPEGSFEDRNVTCFEVSFILKRQEGTRGDQKGGLKVFFSLSLTWLYP